MSVGPLEIGGGRYEAMTSLFCLCYRQDNRPLGVVFIEAHSLLEARTYAAIDGVDQLADFSQGFELDADQASLVPTNSRGRMISPDAARGLMAWIEGEVYRKGLRRRE
jgi:hypothetical protein